MLLLIWLILYIFVLLYVLRLHAAHKQCRTHTMPHAHTVVHTHCRTHTMSPHTVHARRTRGACLRLTKKTCKCAEPRLCGKRIQTTQLCLRRNDSKLRHNKWAAVVRNGPRLCRYNPQGGSSCSSQRGRALSSRPLRLPVMNLWPPLFLCITVFLYVLHCTLYCFCLWYQTSRALYTRNNKKIILL